MQSYSEREPRITSRVYEVERDVRDAAETWLWFLRVVNSLDHVTVLGTRLHVFPGGGITGVVLLAESHAAIHTWPESNYLWAELATCGDPIDLDNMERLIREK